MTLDERQAADSAPSQATVLSTHEAFDGGREGGRREISELKNSIAIAQIMPLVNVKEFYHVVAKRAIGWSVIDRDPRTQDPGLVVEWVVCEFCSRVVAASLQTEAAGRKKGDGKGKRKCKTQEEWT